MKTNGNQETLSQVMNRLREKGYVGEILPEDLVKLEPKDWVIDSTHRFEGNTNPADASILYAIRKRDNSERALLVNAYGVYANSEVNDFIRKVPILRQ